MAIVQSRLTIRSRISCPHCWNEFAPEESLWLAEHPDLIGDTRLGPEHAIRFLPSRFTADGEAMIQKVSARLGLRARHAISK